MGRKGSGLRGRDQVGRHRPPAGFLLRGHAAPVDTGSTVQRYGVRLVRVKPKGRELIFDPPDVLVSLWTTG